MCMGPFEGVSHYLHYLHHSLASGQTTGGFPCGSAGRETWENLQETWVRSLGWEDPLEKGKATHSSILAWRIPWTVWGCKEAFLSLLAILLAICLLKD